MKDSEFRDQMERASRRKTIKPDALTGEYNISYKDQVYTLFMEDSGDHLDVFTDKKDTRVKSKGIYSEGYPMVFKIYLSEAADRVIRKVSRKKYTKNFEAACKNYKSQKDPDTSSGDSSSEGSRSVASRFSFKSSSSESKPRKRSKDIKKKKGKKGKRHYESDSSNSTLESESSSERKKRRRKKKGSTKKKSKKTAKEIKGELKDIEDKFKKLDVMNLGAPSKSKSSMFIPKEVLEKKAGQWELSAWQVNKFLKEVSVPKRKKELVLDFMRKLLIKQGGLIKLAGYVTFVEVKTKASVSVDLSGLAAGFGINSAQSYMRGLLKDCDAFPYVTVVAAFLNATCHHVYKSDPGFVDVGDKNGSFVLASGIYLQQYGRNFSESDLVKYSKVYIDEVQARSKKNVDSDVTPISSSEDDSSDSSDQSS